MPGLVEQPTSKPSKAQVQALELWQIIDSEAENSDCAVCEMDASAGADVGGRKVRHHESIATYIIYVCKIRKELNIIDRMPSKRCER